jgi:hypothetical protein
MRQPYAGVMIRRILLLALLISFNGHAQTHYPTNTPIGSGDITYALLDSPQLVNNLGVGHSQSGPPTFTGTFSFGVSQAEAALNFVAYGGMCAATSAVISLASLHVDKH